MSGVSPRIGSYLLIEEGIYSLLFSNYYTLSSFGYRDCSPSSLSELSLNSFSRSLINANSFLSFCLLPTLVRTFSKLFITDIKSSSTPSLGEWPCSSITCFSYFSWSYSNSLFLFVLPSLADPGFELLWVKLFAPWALADFLSACL